MKKYSIFSLVLSSIFLLQCNSLMTSYDFKFLDFKNKADVEEVEKFEPIFYKDRINQYSDSNYKLIICCLKGSKKIEQVFCFKVCDEDIKTAYVSDLNLENFIKTNNLSSMLKYIEKICSTNGVKKLIIHLAYFEKTENKKILEKYGFYNSLRDRIRMILRGFKLTTDAGRSRSLIMQKNINII